MQFKREGKKLLQNSVKGNCVFVNIQKNKNKKKILVTKSMKSIEFEMILSIVRNF